MPSDLDLHYHAKARGNATTVELLQKSFQQAAGWDCTLEIASPGVLLSPDSDMLAKGGSKGRMLE